MTFERKKILLLLFSSCVSLVFAVPLTSNDTRRSLRSQIPVQETEVLILGAGIAGITAANILSDAGVDFLVLEASHRIGGRLYKKNVQGGGVVELGANWVHGTKNNPIWDLVQRAYLNRVVTMTEPTEGKYIILNETGDDVTKFGNVEGMKKANECLEKLGKEQDDISMKVGLQKCGWKPQTLADQSIEYFYNDFEAAVPPDQISCGVKLKSIGEVAKTNIKVIDSSGDEQVLISDTRGYETIVLNMAEKFIERVKLDHEVTKIATERNKAQIEVVVRKKRKMFEANFVLVTFSVAVLQQQLQAGMFALEQPSQFPIFQEALAKIEMANYLKIFLKFDTRFWREYYNYIFYASEERGFYPVWQNLKTPGIPENDNILLVTVTGQKARDLGEDKERIEKELVPILKKVFAKDIIQLGKPEPKLLRIELKNWQFDPLFRGAYSNPKLGTTSLDFDKLLQPVDGKLFFAGEGLSELYYGFAHGSYLTGQQQAREINSRLKMLEQNRAMGLNYYSVRKMISKPGNKTKY